MVVFPPSQADALTKREKNSSARVFRILSSDGPEYRYRRFAGNRTGDTRHTTAKHPLTRGVLRYNRQYMASRKRRQSLPPLLPRQQKARRRVELLGAAAMSGFVLLIAAVFFASGLQQNLLRSPEVAAVVSAVLVDLANGDRVQNKLGMLTVNPVLVMAAQAKANDMATHGYFSHISPQGIDPWFWFQQVGYKFDYAGENLAVDFSDSGAVNSAWMNSPEHRKNLLSPTFTEVGIATAQGMYQGRLTTFVVQEFGKPATAKAVAQAPVKQAVVPSKATSPALATTQPAETRILGSSAQEPAPQAQAVATTEPAVAAALSADVSGNKPFWAFFVSFPRDTMSYAYYLIGVLVLLALGVETGFEMRKHHRKHAMKAGALLVVMALLFVLANVLFFGEPTLAATAALF